MPEKRRLFENVCRFCPPRVKTRGYVLKGILKPGFTGLGVASKFIQKIAYFSDSEKALTWFPNKPPLKFEARKPKSAASFQGSKTRLVNKPRGRVRKEHLIDSRKDRHVVARLRAPPLRTRMNEGGPEPWVPAPFW